MSYQALGWAWGQDALPGNEKLVLIALADGANAEGLCIKGQKTIAGMVGTSDRTVRENEKRLEERGLLTRDARFRENGSRTSDAIQLHLHPPEEPSAGAPLPAEAARRDHRKSASAPDPLGEPLEDLQPSDGWHEVVPDKMVADAEELLKRKTKAANRLVTRAEMQIAVAALATWNEERGSTRELGANLDDIVPRIRERPSWDADKFVRLVRSAWRLRWWERNGRGRPPTPNVIFSSKSFENVVQDAHDEHAGTLPAGRKRFEKSSPPEQQA